MIGFNFFDLCFNLVNPFLTDNLIVVVNTLNHDEDNGVSFLIYLQTYYIVVVVPDDHQSILEMFGQNFVIVQFMGAYTFYIVDHNHFIYELNRITYSLTFYVVRLTNLKVFNYRVYKELVDNYVFLVTWKNPTDNS